MWSPVQGHRLQAMKLSLDLCVYLLHTFQTNFSIYRPTCTPILPRHSFLLMPEFSFFCGTNELVGFPLLPKDSLSTALDLHVASVILLTLSLQNCVDIFHMFSLILFVLMGFCLLFANLFSLVDYCFGRKLR